MEVAVTPAIREIPLDLMGWGIFLIIISSLALLFLGLLGPLFDPLWVYYLRVAAAVLGYVAAATVLRGHILGIWISPVYAVLNVVTAVASWGLLSPLFIALNLAFVVNVYARREEFG